MSATNNQSEAKRTFFVNPKGRVVAVKTASHNHLILLALHSGVFPGEKVLTARTSAGHYARAECETSELPSLLEGMTARMRLELSTFRQPVFGN